MSDRVETHANDEDPLARFEVTLEVQTRSHVKALRELFARDHTYGPVQRLSVHREGHHAQRGFSRDRDEYIDVRDVRRLDDTVPVPDGGDPDLANPVVPLSDGPRLVLANGKAVIPRVMSPAGDPEIYLGTNQEAYVFGEQIDHPRTEIAFVDDPDVDNHEMIQEVRHAHDV